MPQISPFDTHCDQYEQWFDEHLDVYLSEIEAICTLIPSHGKGVEIGIGTGRFALPLGIKYGVEPSREMRRLSSRKGLKVHDGIAEALPYQDQSFDFALMVTTICFVDDVRKSFEEVHRILKPGGCFIVGMVDKESPLGQTYLQMKNESAFYRVATFYSTEEVQKHLKEAGFGDFEFVQTVFGDLGEIDEVQTCRESFGEGGFVVIKATK